MRRDEDKPKNKHNYRDIFLKVGNEENRKIQGSDRRW